MALAVKKAGGGSGRSSEEIKLRKLGRMEKRVADLNKRYPTNKYKIVETLKYFTIVLESGKFAAKIKREAAKKGTHHARQSN